MNTPRPVLVLREARTDFKAIKQYILARFGKATWNTVNLEFKAALQLIATSPMTGSPVEELQSLGMTNIRSMLVRQTRIIYEVDDEQILIHLFIDTRRDFRTHLLHRMLR